MDLFRLRPSQEGYLVGPAREGEPPVWITPGRDGFSACFALCLDSLRSIGAAQDGEGSSQCPAWPPVLHADDSVSLVLQSEDRNLRCLVRGTVLRCTEEEGLGAARMLWRNVLVALSGAAESLSFVPSHNPCDYAETVRPVKYRVSPRGLAVSPGSSIGFAPGAESASPQSAIYLSWPFGQKDYGLDSVANLLLAACENTDLSVILHGYSIAQSTRKRIESFTAGEWSLCSVDGQPVVDQSEGQRVEALLAAYERSPNGARIDCQISAGEDVPETLLLLIGKALYGEQPIEWQRTAEAQRFADNDLRGLLPGGTSCPLPVPSPGFFRRRNLRTTYPHIPNHLPDDGIQLGLAGVPGRQRKVRFADVDRTRHSYIIGATGTGKSTLLSNMIRQDILRGAGVCLLDPHGDLYANVLETIPPERADDVVVVDAGDFERAVGLNILEIKGRNPDVQASFISNELLRIFSRLYNMEVVGGPMFELYMRNALLLVMQNRNTGGTIIDVVRLLGNSRYRKSLLAGCTNRLVVEFWRDIAHRAGGEASLENIAPYITSKLNQFTYNALLRPIIRQSQSTVDFRQCMDEGKIVLVNLAKGLIGEKDARFLGMLVIGKLFAAAMSRVDKPLDQRRPFHVYIDEAQNLSTDTMADILAEGRKFGLVLTLANQTLSQIAGNQQGNLMQAVLGNVGSLLLFRVGPLDSEALMGFFGSDFARRDLESMEDRHVIARLLNQGWPMPPFVFQTLPPIADEWNSSVRDEVNSRIESNRQVYTRAVAEVDADARLKEEPEAEKLRQAKANTEAKEDLDVLSRVEEEKDQISAVVRKATKQEADAAPQPNNNEEG